MSGEKRKFEQIMVWCGVVAQLNRTRSNRLLKGEALPYPLFVLLRHFCHDAEREWTIAQLTRAFETGQPGMTKKVQKLLDAGLLSARVDAQDGRRRWLRVTNRGKRMKDRMVALLEPDQQAIFENWDAADVADLHRLLDRLRQQLDAARDDLHEPRRRST